jgi:hypothetical protein
MPQHRPPPHLLTRVDGSDRGNGPPQVITPDHDPLSWTGRQISIIPKQIDEKTAKWQKQMQNRGVEYESLYDMQQREIQRKQPKTKLVKRHSSWSSIPSMHSSASAVAWVGSQQQEILRPASMLEIYEGQNRIGKQRLVNANAGVFHAGQGSAYHMPIHPQDEILRRKHEEMMRARMPAMQKEAQMEREAHVRRSFAQSLPVPHSGRRRGLSLNSGTRNSHGYSRLAQRPQTSIGHTRPLLHAATLDTDITTLNMLTGRLGIDSCLHRPTSRQTTNSPSYHSHSQRLPADSFRGSACKLPISKTEWPQKQSNLPSGQLQCTDFDRPIRHNHSIVGRSSQGAIDCGSAIAPGYLSRPRTAPLGRKGS